jgi:hypothetical protein
VYREPGLVSIESAPALSFVLGQSSLGICVGEQCWGVSLWLQVEWRATTSG